MSETRNLSKERRENLLKKIDELRVFFNTNEDIEKKERTTLLNHLFDIEKEVNNKKYGLVYEEHEEEIDRLLKTHIPVLTEDEKLYIDNGGQMNFILEGDNLASLKLLEKTHKGKIDVIYIDPPYNRGEDDFIYSDDYIDKTDYFMHSKWASFMQKRLKIANSLLSKNGNIFISIDYNELATLKILCDEVFGPEKFVDILCWERTETPSNLDKKSKKAMEFILCYTNASFDFRFIGLTKESKSSNGLMNQTNTPHELIFPANVVDTGLKDGIYKKGNYGTDKYEIKLIEDTEVSNGIFIKPIKLFGKFKWGQQYLDNAIKSNIKISIRTKAFSPSYEKEEYEPEVPWNLINKDFGVDTNESATSHLIDILKNDDFDYPKPVSLIQYLIKFNSGKTILDFFAGSGTTAEAVLNTEGAKFIICTDNSINPYQKLKYIQDNGYLKDYNPDKKTTTSKIIMNKINDFFEKNQNIYDKLFVNTNEWKEYGICRHITYPRVKTVITGTRLDKSKYSDGLAGSLKYMKVDYIDTQDKLYEDYQYDLETHMKELLELQYGINMNDSEEYKLLLTEDDKDDFCDKIIKDIDKYKKNNKLKKVFIGNDILFDIKLETLHEELGVEIVEIPASYYEEV